ncbi:MAG TPA: OsmC family protein [Ilumatobacter sp.]|nr:OsmC family protein [Ilumatobacter sp.]
MSDDSLRQVTLERTELGGYVIRNARGGALVVGTIEGSRFTPVELLLGALAACGAVDLDLITSKRAEPLSLTATAEGHKIRDELGNRLVDLLVTYDVQFPEGDAGDAARAVVPRTIGQIESRLCTVSRTVAVGTPVKTVAV